jgi:hypothetical protein
VYAGILLLAGLFAGAFWDIIKGRGITLFKVASGALIVSILIFVPVNGLSYSTLVFQPFWFLETMMAVSDRFYWPKFAEALMNYRLGGVYIKLILGYALAFLIFWYGNLGTRIFKEKKVWDWVRNYKKLESTEVIVITIIVVGIAFPLLFIQQGTPWNTIQFLYYSLMFSGIVAGIAFGELLSKNKNAIMFPSSILLIFLTIPTTLGTLNQYLPSRPPAKLSILELQALTFLSKENDGVVLTYPFNPIAARIAEANPPRPLYLYESSAYVSAFSKKDVFLEDEVNLNITGYDWRERRQEVEVFYNSLDEEFSYKFLRDNNISYIYWLKGQRARLGEDQLGIEKIFENEERKQEFIERGPALVHAPHEVVVLADTILAADMKKIQAFATVHMVTEKTAKEPTMNPFALANVFASGDKKKTWLLFQEVIAHDDEVEKTHGMIWWKLKDMVQKKSVFNAEQLKRMARALVAVYHEARLGSGLDMKERLEQFFLTMPDLKK